MSLFRTSIALVAGSSDDAAARNIAGLSAQYAGSYKVD